MRSITPSAADAINFYDLTTCSMSKLWDPESTLGLCSDARCVGYAPSKGRKCMMPIRYDNIKRCKSLVSEMAEQLPDVDSLEPMLRCLAKHGLCVRFHQDQIEDMVRKWTKRLLAAYPQGRMRQNPTGLGRAIFAPTSHVSIFATSPSTTRSAPIVPTSSPSIREQSEMRNLHDSIAAMQETIRIAQRRLDVLGDMTSPTSTNPAITRISTLDVSSLRISGPASVQLNPISRTQTSIVPVSRLEGLNVVTNRHDQAVPLATLAPVSARSPTMPSSSTRAAIIRSGSPDKCPRTHVHRLPFDEECSVCYDDTPLSSCDPENLVWCRSGCGRTLHKSCLEEWRNQSAEANSSQPLRCMICRTIWDEDCDCTESCKDSHVRRRMVDGECSICRTDLKGSDDQQGDSNSRVLSWCKAECGRSVHQYCFARWKES